MVQFLGAAGWPSYRTVSAPFLHRFHFGEAVRPTCQKLYLFFTISLPTFIFAEPVKRKPPQAALRVERMRWANHKKGVRDEWRLIKGQQNSVFLGNPNETTKSHGTKSPDSRRKSDCRAATWSKPMAKHREYEVNRKLLML
jgi:hypothetical protein